MADKIKIPRHIAIIMDGNGRWARQRGLPRTAGHRKGIARVKEIVRGAGKLGVEVLTFFAFSHENWSRPKAEINVLMRYLNVFLVQEIPELDKRNVCFRVIGRKDPIPKYLQNKIKNAEEKTKDNTGLKVILALNYGSRQEIIDAARAFAQEVAAGRAQVEKLDEAGFRRYFYAPEIPDPDLLIRTSAQLRLSNFLLWQLSYAELYFSPKFWPEFGMEELKKAITEFGKRERRFGGIDVGEKGN